MCIGSDESMGVASMEVTYESSLSRVFRALSASVLSLWV